MFMFNDFHKKPKIKKRKEEEKKNYVKLMTMATTPQYKKEAEAKTQTDYILFYCGCLALNFNGQ